MVEPTVSTAARCETRRSVKVQEGREMRNQKFRRGLGNRCVAASRTLTTALADRHTASGNSLRGSGGSPSWQRIESTVVSRTAPTQNIRIVVSLRRTAIGSFVRDVEHVLRSSPRKRAEALPQWQQRRLLVRPRPEPPQDDASPPPTNARTSSPMERRFHLSGVSPGSSSMARGHRRKHVSRTLHENRRCA